MNQNIRIAVIGLGYVGLPLAVEFAKRYKTIGFDIDIKRIDELKRGYDRTWEVAVEELEAVLTDNCTTPKGLYCTNTLHAIESCNYFIVAVPTPVDKHNNPDLTLLCRATEIVGAVLKKGDIVIYESTVYPGATEEVCVPVLEKVSGMKFNEEFFTGYSPERINPGDKLHTFSKILKVTSGSTPEVAEKVDQLYRSVVKAGTYKASSIKVAEAAKVIENAQRDINIAFVNELSMIFNMLGIDTNEVLMAAGTKWNFLGFKPGLVGGHCIGVDPYYLAQKAQEIGYHPEVILSGRRLNDSMGAYVAHRVVELMIKKEIPVKNAKILVLGITFKENCADIRNTKVVDILRILKGFETDITVYDPWAIPAEVMHEYGYNCCNELKAEKKFDVIVLAVAHTVFDTLDIQALCNQRKVVYDVKGVLPKEWVDARL